MSKILKIERQPWMPEWATHWCLDVDSDGQLIQESLFQFNDGKLGYFTSDNYYSSAFSDMQDLLDNWQYVHEITEPKPTD